MSALLAIQQELALLLQQQPLSHKLLHMFCFQSLLEQMLHLYNIGHINAAVASHCPVFPQLKHIPDQMASTRRVRTNALVV